MAQELRHGILDELVVYRLLGLVLIACLSRERVYDKRKAVGYIVEGYL